MMRHVCTIASQAALSPHPEERGTRVSKDEAATGASWFETALTRLLTMRVLTQWFGAFRKPTYHELGMNGTDHPPHLPNSSLRT